MPTLSYFSAPLTMGDLAKGQEKEMIETGSRVFKNQVWSPVPSFKLNIMGGI